MNRKLWSSLIILGAIFSSTPSSVLADSSVLNIETKATTVDVTVPGSTAIVFNADGTNATPTNFVISNQSKIAGINLSSVELDAGLSGWNLVDDSTDLKVQAVDTKNIRLKVGKLGQEQLVSPSAGSVSSSGTAQLGKALFSIPAKSQEKMNFVVERGAFGQSEAEAKAFDMTLNFEFNS